MRSIKLSIQNLNGVRTNVRFIPGKQGMNNGIYSRTLGVYVVVSRDYVGPIPQPYEWWEVVLKFRLNEKLIIADPINLNEEQLYLFIPSPENCTIIQRDNIIYIKPIITAEIYGKSLALDGAWRHAQSKLKPCIYVLVNCDYDGDKDVLSKDVSA